MFDRNFNQIARSHDAITITITITVIYAQLARRVGGQAGQPEGQVGSKASPKGVVTTWF